MDDMRILISMSDIPLNKSEVTKLLRRIIREAGTNLGGDDKVLCKHLSSIIRLNDNFEVDDEDHVKSLKYLNEITEVMKRFEEEIAAAVVRELGLA
jgi:hypothetical protein